MTVAPETTAPLGSLTVPVSVARAACWPNATDDDRSKNKTRTGRERNNAGVITILSSKNLCVCVSGLLLDAGSDLLVDARDDLPGLTLTTRLRQHAHDRLRIRAAHEKPAIGQRHLHAVARVERKLLVLLPQHLQHRWNF